MTECLEYEGHHIPILKRQTVFSHLAVLRLLASFQVDRDNFALTSDFKQELAAAALHLRQQPPEKRIQCAVPRYAAPTGLTTTILNLFGVRPRQGADIFVSL